MINSNKLVTKLLYILLFISPVYGQSTNTDPCKSQGYVIGFFNGVWNTRSDAKHGLEAIKNLFGTTYNNESLDYKAFYNETGTEMGATLFEDLAETFEQRARELDGALDNRWEIFWETLTSSSDESSFLESLTTKIGRVSPELKNLLGDLYTAILTKSVAGWSFLLSQPPTEFDSARNRSILIELANEKKKLLLIAHSQGNLFVNQAYDAVLTVANADIVKVVHIAPASPTLRGKYALADLDLVINALRIQGLDTVPKSNVSLPASHLLTDDFSGHKLVETYLNSKRATLTKVRSLIQTALDDMNVQTAPGYSFTTLSLPGDPDPYGWISINARGEVVGSTSGFLSGRAGPVGYLYDTATKALTILVDPFCVNYLCGSHARGINDDGTVVGSYFVSSESIYGFVYKNNKWDDRFNYPLNYPPLGFIGSGRPLWSINNNGLAVGGSVSGSDWFLVNTNNGVFNKLHFQLGPGLVSAARWEAALSINDNGDVVGSYYDSRYRGFIYSNGVYTSLDYPGSMHTFVNAINNKNQIVGYYVDKSGKGHGFVENSGNYITLDYPDATGTTLISINNNGWILGRHYNGGVPFLAIPSCKSK